MLSFLLRAACVVAMAAALPARSTNGSASGLDKRWMSIQSNFIPELRSSWPALSKIYTSRPETDEQWIRFCFADQGSADRLLPLLLQGIAAWEPARQVSNFRIMPDPSCGDNYLCVCNQQMPEDTLRVINTLERRSDGMIMVGSVDSTFGYQATVPEDEVSSNNRWPNWIKFGSDLEGASIIAKPDGGYVTKEARARFAMSHELGHTLGLFHEHQRIGAVSNGEIDFYCENLVDYDTTAERVLQSDDPIFRGKSLAQRMSMVCFDEDLAVDFGFYEALNYIPRKEALSVLQGTACSQSKLIDYQSIMLYDSVSSVSKDGQAVILKPQGRLGPGQSNAIHSGGAVDFDKKSLSVPDIVRVSQLYPTGKQEHLETLRKWLRQGMFDPVHVVIRGQGIPNGKFETVVYPSPTDEEPDMRFVKYREPAIRPISAERDDGSEQSSVHGPAVAQTGAGLHTGIADYSGGSAVAGVAQYAQQGGVSDGASDSAGAILEHQQRHQQETGEHGVGQPQTADETQIGGFSSQGRQGTGKGKGRLGRVKDMMKGIFVKNRKGPPSQRGRA